MDLPILYQLEKENVIDEDILTICLFEGEKNQCMFVVDFLDENPEKLDEWTGFYFELVKILNQFKPNYQFPPVKFFDMKKTVFAIIKNLERKELIRETMKNLRGLENGNLRILAAEAIGEIGGEEQLDELQELLNKDRKIQSIAEKKNIENPIQTAIKKIKSRLE